MKILLKYKHLNYNYSVTKSVFYRYKDIQRINLFIYCITTSKFNLLGFYLID